MSDTNKLNDSELENVSGGVLTPEAEDWINRNRDEIISRAPAMLRGLADFALNIVATNSTVYDVAALKAELKKYGVDADDLD